jgi:PA14 domain
MRKIHAFGLVAVVCAVGCEFSVKAGTDAQQAGQQAVQAAGAVVAPVAKGFKRVPRRFGTPATSSGGIAVADAGPSPSSSGGTTPAEPPTVAGPTAFGDNVADAESFMGSIFFLPPDTQKLPDFTKLTPAGTLFTKSFNVKDRDFTMGFPGVDARSEFFGIVYDGPLTVSKQGIYQIRLVSDDGARILIDDTLIVSNDGIHTFKEVKQLVDLSAQVHSFHVEYFQAAKPRVALEVWVSSPALNMPERLLTTTL